MGLSTLAILDLRFVYCKSTSCSVILAPVQYTILSISSFKVPGISAKHASYQSFRKSRFIFSANSVEVTRFIVLRVSS